MCLVPESAPGGTVVPRQEYAYTMRLFCTQCWSAVRHTFEKFLGGSLLMSPSSYKGGLNESMQHLLKVFSKEPRRLISCAGINSNKTKTLFRL
jgi:4-hydroxyphenylacetate 3-monooxygenase